MLNNFKHFYLAIVLLLVGGKLPAATLSESSVFFRCHSQFVRTRPSADDELLMLVKAGKLTAAEACVQLLDESNLDSSGTLKKKSQPDDRPLRILRTFQAFHMTWFPNKELVREGTDVLTSNLYDVNEMGYHLTFNLFGENAKYSETVTRATSFRGVRFYTRPATNLIEPSNDGRFDFLNDKKWLMLAGDAVSATWVPQMVETGKLIGLKPLNPGENLVRFFGEKKKAYAGSRQEFSVSASLGAGVLGTVPYLLLNAHPVMRGSDGGLGLHRSWSKAVFSDLLCRSMPVLRKEDAVFFVQKSSAIPFRREQACMQCHSTLDPLASTVRNITGMRPGKDPESLNSPRVIAFFDVTEAAEAEVKDSDDKFHLRPPNGSLYFRNYKGELVDQKISSLNELGAALAKTDDLYVCAAKRYFEFMTGVDVEIGDFTQEAFAKESQESLAYRDFVIGLGLNLKKNQSVKKMIQEIIMSPFYRQSDYGHSL